MATEPVTVVDFMDLVRGQHRANIKKNGKQDVLLLMTVLIKEVGEVGRAVLEDRLNRSHITRRNILYECVDAAAVLLAIAEEANDGDPD
jgi:NTP pyrophosphatase (non-canonical NTP hydrolase)